MNARTCYKFFLSVVVFLFFLPSCAHKTNFKRSEVVFLELNSDLSHVSEYTEHFHNGVRLALQEINAKGGINGREVSVIFNNDYLDYQQAKTSIVTAKNANILAAFGTFFTPAAQGASSGAGIAEIPFLSCSYNNSVVFEQPNSYTYSLRPGLYGSIKALINEAIKIGDLNRWLIISYSNVEGNQAAQFFQQEFIKAYKVNPTGTGNIIDSKTKEKSQPQNTNPTSFLFEHIKIAPFKATPLLMNANLADVLSRVKAVLILTNGKDLQSLIDKIPLPQYLVSKVVFVPFAGEPEWLKYVNHGTTPQNWITTGYPWYVVKNKEHESFYRKYNKAYNKVPRYASILGYVAVYMLAQAATKIDLDEPDIQKLRTQFNIALAHVNLTNTPLGTIHMRRDHITSLGVYTGKLYEFSQNIMSTKGNKMVLKDIRMNNVFFYPHTKIHMSEEHNNAIRQRNFKRNLRHQQQLEKRSVNRERKTANLQQ